MAQHDYIIANQSGAAFRSDLNNGLAAAVSNNSGAAQPSTTYAYMWWPDTTTGLLKIRNAANNGWVTVGTLASTNLGLLSLAGGTMTGALLLDDSGTVSLPALAFDSDADTGIFRSAANTLNVATNGVENIEFGTSEVVVNDGGADIDFRIEGDTKANLFFIDAGTDKVIIDGITQPSADGTAGQSVVTNGSGVLSLASIPPAGTIIWYAANTAPTGYLKANGATVSRSTYATLFSAIGTTYGVGNGSTTFALPDLRGEFVRGWDDSRGVDSGRVIGTAQGDAIRNITGRVIDFVYNESQSEPGGASGAFRNGNLTNLANSQGLSGSGGYPDEIWFDASLQVPTAAENRPRNIAMLACIKF